MCDQVDERYEELREELRLKTRVDRNMGSEMNLMAFRVMVNAVTMGQGMYIHIGE